MAIAFKASIESALAAPKRPHFAIVKIKAQTTFVTISSRVLGTALSRCAQPPLAGVLDKVKTSCRYRRVGSEDTDQSQLGRRCFPTAGLNPLPQAKAVGIGVVDDQQRIFPIGRSDSELGVERRRHKRRVAEICSGDAFATHAGQEQRFDVAVALTDRERYRTCAAIPG